MADRFRIYYGDRSVWEGGELETAPRLNVQFIAEIYDNHKYMHTGGDWFCFNGQRWQCRSIPQDFALKGLLIDDIAFEQLKQVAFTWLLDR